MQLSKSKQKLYYDDFTKQLEKQDPSFHIPSNGLELLIKEIDEVAQLQNKVHKMISSSEPLFDYERMFIKPKKENYRRKKNLYNTQLTKLKLPNKKEELFENIYDLWVDWSTNFDTRKRILFNRKPITHNPVYKGFGKKFSSFKEKKIYEIKMQHVLKEMGFYNDLVDGIWGSNSKVALNNLMDFLEIPKKVNRIHFFYGLSKSREIRGVKHNIHNIDLDFTDNGIVAKIDANQAASVSKKIVNKELDAATEVCLNNNGNLKWSISFANVSMDIELPNLDLTIKASLKNGRNYSFSTKKKTTPGAKSEPCNFSSLCWGTNPIGIKCGILDFKGFNSLNISIDGRSINVPLK